MDHGTFILFTVATGFSGAFGVTHKGTPRSKVNEVSTCKEDQGEEPHVKGNEEGDRNYKRLSRRPLHFVGGRFDFKSPGS